MGDVRLGAIFPTPSPFAVTYPASRGGGCFCHACSAGKPVTYYAHLRTAANTSWRVSYLDVDVDARPASLARMSWRDSKLPVKADWCHPGLHAYKFGCVPAGA